MKPEPTSHAGDCTFYASLCNGEPSDGICTCGYGWNLVRKGDYSEFYSDELQTFLEAAKAIHGKMKKKYPAQVLEKVYAKDVPS